MAHVPSLSGTPVWQRIKLPGTRDLPQPGSLKAPNWTGLRATSVCASCFLPHISCQQTPADVSRQVTQATGRS